MLVYPEPESFLLANVIFRRKANQIAGKKKKKKAVQCFCHTSLKYRLRKMPSDNNRAKEGNESHSQSGEESVKTRDSNSHSISCHRTKSLSQNLSLPDLPVKHSIYLNELLGF